ncbi:MAG TPA: response regulator [Caulobacteraceae bacterium]|jgi:hypothetical protein
MADIMIVEDDDAFGYVIERQLLNAGHSVTRFTDWKGVLERLESEANVDVLLTDLRLPEGGPNGVSIAMMASARRRKLKVICMTAYQETADAAGSTFPTVILKTDGTANVLAAINLALAS